MKKKYLVIALLLAVVTFSMSGCYCERYHPHYYHRY
jgi:hypothetical protein